MEQGPPEAPSVEDLRGHSGTPPPPPPLPVTFVEKGIEETVVEVEETQQHVRTPSEEDSAREKEIEELREARLKETRSKNKTLLSDPYTMSADREDSDVTFKKEDGIEDERKLLGKTLIGVNIVTEEEFADILEGVSRGPRSPKSSSLPEQQSSSDRERLIHSSLMVKINEVKRGRGREDALCQCVYRLMCYESRSIQELMLT